MLMRYSLVYLALHRHSLVAQFYGSAFLAHKKDAGFPARSVMLESEMKQ